MDLVLNCTRACALLLRLLVAVGPAGSTKAGMSMNGGLCKRDVSRVEPLSECCALRVISGLVLGGGSGRVLWGIGPGSLHCVEPVLTVE